IFLLVIILSIPQVLAGRHAMPEGYYQASLNTRIIYAIWYIGLIALLGVMSFEVHGMLEGHRSAHGIGI
ncbi:MAG TPA: hypothetical protein VFM46_08555, partial [Pseudomonadales bacterium]|nr:hypothetical protein [Pseudomonadales bacterium]